MTLQPQVDLLFDPRDLHEQARREVIEAARKNDTVRGSLARALFAQHVYMIKEAREHAAREKDLTPEAIVRVLDLAWQAFTPNFVKISGPQIALAYGRALKNVKEGEVPEAYIRSLAEGHARRLSGYFHETSKDAVVQGFNTYVNRRIPARAAADRALMAYGITPRQMSGYTSNVALDAKVASSMFGRVQQKALNYIAKSLRSRIEKFASQEEHNLGQQAEQITWMWMIEHDQVPEVAEKIWRTARDEKVCVNCGPMHGKVVKVNEQFVLPNGVKVWVPGPHPNCRCKVRFRVPRHLEAVGKASDWKPQEHPRGGGGRFRAANRPGPRFMDRPELQLELPETERPELKLDLTPVEAPPVVSFADVEDAKPVSMRPVSMQPKSVSMGGKPVSMRDGFQGKISLSPSREKVSLRQRFEAVSLRRDIEAAISVMGEKLAELPEVKQKSHFRNTINFMMPDDRGRRVGPIYRIISPGEEIDPRGRVRFDHTQVWTNDPASASARALAWRADIIDHTVARLRENGPRDYTPEPGTPNEGFETYLDLTDEQMEHLVRWVANRNSSEEANSNDDKMFVSIYGANLDRFKDDEEDFWSQEEIPLRHLAEIYDLDPKDFEMQIATVTEGHDSDLGSTDVRDDEVGGTDEIAVTLSGDFEVRGVHQGDTILGRDKAPNITFFHLEPADIETKTFTPVE